MPRTKSQLTPTPSTPLSDLVSLTQLSESLGISRDEIRRYIRRGTIPHPDVVLSPIRQYWKRLSIQAWLDQQATVGGEGASHE